MAGHTEGVAGIRDTAFRDLVAYFAEFSAPFRALGRSPSASRRSPEAQAAVEAISAEVGMHDVVVYGLQG